MNQQIQDIADKVEENIAAKASLSPDPARISAVDHAEILNNILVQVDTLVSASVPSLPGVAWYIPPGTPIFTTNTVTETESIINDTTSEASTLYTVPSLTLTFPLAAAGKKRKDAIVATYGLEGSFYTRIAGAEVDALAIAGTPTLNPLDMFVRWIDVTDGAIASAPNGAVYSATINGGTKIYPDPVGNIDLPIDFEVQDSMDYDGTGTMVSTTDAVNNSITRNAKLFGYTGITNKKDTVELIPLNTTTIRIAAVTSALFWDELFTAGQVSDDAFKSFPQKDYLLSELATSTGGNVNQNPITTDGLYVRYLGYDKNGNVISSASNFLEDKTVVQLGFTTVLRSGGVISFLGGTTVGARNVFSQPILASSLELDRTSVTLKSDVVIGFNTGAASLRSASGSIYGLSINWRSAGNPSNDLPIDRTPYTGVSTITFTSINPSFLTQTSAPTPHTLWTETEGGIAINNRIWNTSGTPAAATLDNNKFSVKRVLIGTRGGLWLQDGEHAGTAGYATIDAAKAALSSHVFTDSIVPPGVVTEIARIAFKKGVTDFTNAGEFFITSTFSGAGSSGIDGSTSFASITGNPTDNTLLAADLAAKADKALAINTQSSSYTLVLTDAGGMVRMNVATANTLTIPPNSSVAFPIGTQIVWSQPGTGQTTFVAGSGVTATPSFGGGMKSAGQGGAGSIVKVASNSWDIYGTTTA